MPELFTLLHKIDWNLLDKWEFSFIHGDLQFDNIIYNKDLKRFKLIDWRQDFAGSLDHGDLYYDLAKLLVGIEIDLKKVKLGHFKVHVSNINIDIEFPRVENADLYIKSLHELTQKKSLSMNQVRTLAALCLLSMAGLHQTPLAEAFYYTGWEWLSKQDQLTDHT